MRALMIASTAFCPTFFTAPSPKRIASPFSSRTGVNVYSLALTSGGSTRMLISRHSLMYFTTFRDVARFRSQQRGHEIDRIVRLQVRRHEGQIGIGRGVRLIEAVAGELLHLIENLFDLLRWDGRAPARP